VAAMRPFVKYAVLIGRAHPFEAQLDSPYGSPQPLLSTHSARQSVAISCCAPFRVTLVGVDHAGQSGR
jgi:hypothetical protein